MPFPKAGGRPFDHDLSQAHKSEGGDKVLNNPSLGFYVFLYSMFFRHLYPDASDESHSFGLAAFHGHLWKCAPSASGLTK